MRPLEQKCVHPGYWRIEGYDVEHARLIGARWHIRLFGKLQASFGSLRECREWIADQVGGDWVE